MNEFDPKRPYSEVQGDSLAALYQDGQYFTSDRQPCSDEDAAKPSANGSFVNQVEQRVEEERAKDNAKRPLTLVDNTNPSTNSAADIEAARRRATAAKQEAPPNDEPVVAEIDSKRARRAVLQKLHVSQLRSMVAELGLEPVTGRGSKKANIKLLLANTE